MPRGLISGITPRAGAGMSRGRIAKGQAGEGSTQGVVHGDAEAVLRAQVVQHLILQPGDQGIGAPLPPAALSDPPQLPGDPLQLRVGQPSRRQADAGSLGGRVAVGKLEVHGHRWQVPHLDPALLAVPYLHT